MKRAVWTWAGNAIALYAAVAFVGDATLAGWTSSTASDRSSAPASWSGSSTWC